MSKRYLLLEDGSYFEGTALGGNDFKIGEVVFNTNMFAYQDILSNPSYGGKLIAMTYPMVGNYGINSNGFESKLSPIFGFIISECAEIPGNYKAQTNLEEFLKLRDIPAIKDVDTRMLTRHLRENGSMRGVLTDSIENLDAQVEKLKNFTPDRDIVNEISIKNPFHIPNIGKRVILIDLGETNNILKKLNSRDLDVVVVPHNYSYREIEALHPRAIIISNGPGSPEYLEDTIENIKNLIGKYPIFGIGLGHQLIAKSFNLEIKDSKSASFGSNHPVRNVDTKDVKNYTSTNSYFVESKYLEENGFKITHVDIKDERIEGMENTSKRVFSVQFIPDEEEYDIFMDLLDKESLNA